MARLAVEATDVFSEKVVEQEDLGLGPELEEQVKVEPEGEESVSALGPLRVEPEARVEVWIQLKVASPPDLMVKPGPPSFER